MAKIIGANLRHIRQMRNYSLDDVSAMCHVSKSMLSEIERGKKSPTVTVMYKISQGIHVSLNDLLKLPMPGVEVVHAEELVAHGNLNLQILYEYDIQNSMEIHRVCMAPRTSHAADSHGEDIWEYVMVMDGVFTLTLGDESYTINKGESLRFHANRHHVYVNPTDEETWIFNLILYKS